tara:strand:- start:3600 stop:4196 length:597 start_codon:yes stop_codon:yes gene_type:complete
MKRLEIKNNDNPNFIGNWDIENNELCNKMIEFFEKNPDRQIKGQTAGGIDENVKKCTDITIRPEELQDKKFEIFNKYFENLFQCFNDYKEQYDFLKTFVKKLHIGPFNIQKYYPGDHFNKVHAERTDLSTIHRLFAWMTYLNDVEEGGTTDFDYYKIKVKPKAGKTLIWPAEWTHAHKGSILKGGEKYIITGWLHFTD